jgi:hypothetical protein
MIAFTNHALDHMLCSVLDADITRKIVRLGSRSSDERISQYSIETLELVDGQSRLDRTFGSRRRELKDVQEEIKKLMDKVLHLDLESDSTEIMEYLSTFHPEHHEYLAHPPTWTQTLRELFDNKNDDNGVWRVQGRKGKTHKQDTSYYAYWKEAGDLDLIGAVVDGSYVPWKTPTPEPEEAPVKNKFNVLKVEDHDEPIDDDAADELPNLHTDVPSNGEESVEESWLKVEYDLALETDIQNEDRTVVSPSSEPSADDPGSNTQLGPADFEDPEGFLVAIGCVRNPAIPTSDRPLDELIDYVGDVWTMSRSERCKLHEFWANQARIELTQNQTGEFERLHALHAKILRECNEGKEEV